MHLMLTGLRARRAPRTDYGVYLNPGDTPPAEPDRGRYLGTLDFETAGTGFDVTGLLTRFGRTARSTLIVTIVPEDVAHPDAAPIIGALAVIAA